MQGEPGAGGGMDGGGSATETAVRVRRDVWELDPWDDTLLWYARAVGAMRQRELADPASWRYQAAIHGYRRANDPLRVEGEVLPSAVDQQRFWTQCQHNTWYFLPWHRMYLGYFEQHVQATISSLGGPDDWALPYWNYGRGQASRALPPAFVAETMPDGSPNPLRIPQRAPSANQAVPLGSSDFVDVRMALESNFFTGSPNAGAGFGGPVTGFAHFGPVPGLLERVPHGAMHMAVNGFMGAFETAALDPIFWLHHANIDRLWTVWKKRNNAHLDPQDMAWQSLQEFTFHNGDGSVVGTTCEEVTDSEASPFAYRYEDESDPLAETEATPGAELPTMPGDVQPIAVTAEPTRIGEAVASTQLKIDQVGGPAIESAAPRRTFVNVENIKGTSPVPQRIYLNVPAGDDPGDHPELYVGLLPMFGLAEASEPGEHSSGSGLSYSLDVTSVLENLGARWDGSTLNVTFVPDLGSSAPVIEGAETMDTEVSRISVYVEG